MSNSQPDLTKTSALSPVGALGKPGKRGHRREGSTGDRLHSFFQKTVTTPVNSLIGTNSSDRRNSMKASTSDERTRSDWGPGVTAYGADYTDYRRKLMNIKNAKGELQQDMVVDLEQLMLQQEEVDDKHVRDVAMSHVFTKLYLV
ncbi:hypothetical protein SARC_07681 [Sphaeroforma arctica JP610]|uniref:Uncharacterized protein n=1 Tax=Sphaeroforma arctica JP610 TaxID=667725 RepID=A0A0L0FT23_9EUKA|nr:hypothetical protein, variant [Sphaeroforma arctica JP610]XP_014153848.1 hypothetical protein SARC_07681 [Sphaeroforma arctica JP610]KNC79945.1 hypothetical protein, variant [Sphaeroforma arctica JP610]KNC79946.1 hypothetical protein SARC_07681 [Sphaeroforma arctica JP610]|eukprot:XP_014153847.1 hypothetical protein, variant [Sphaeroforma arctica JP610]